MKTTNRRNFLGKGAAAAAVTAVAAVPAKAQTASPTKKVIYRDGKKPAKPSTRMSGTVAYGNLIFISGVGYHKEGDIKVHTKAVLDSIKEQLESAGSSMSKVLKCNVYLNDMKDFEGMNSVYDGSFGDEPPARTTIAAAWIPGNSLVEIDVIACI
jgi:2-iminobutanoate/2-iminopropanoate deaminase